MGISPTREEPLGRSGGRAEPAIPNDNAAHAGLPARPRDRVLRAACVVVPPLWTALGLRRIPSCP
ncbi:hypothetical protein ACODT5_31230 [Streptomyces sp. 5.8]|uniref:hypothetical protein n=1 Tax=Streptomyces sp. 5.8 TaxID=3406571 RepID=UPI003BB4D50B